MEVEGVTVVRSKFLAMSGHGVRLNRITAMVAHEQPLFKLAS